MVLRGGKTVKQPAGDLGVSQYSIYQWKKKFFPPERSAGVKTFTILPAAQCAWLSGPGRVRKADKLTLRASLQKHCPNGKLIVTLFRTWSGGQEANGVKGRVRM
jgi:hypothetical protein